MRSAIYTPAATVAVFPSIVAEAGPLVLIEAMASGCYPMGTYFAGMGANIDIAASALDPQQGQYKSYSQVFAGKHTQASGPN